MIVHLTAFLVLVVVTFVVANLFHFLEMKVLARSGQRIGPDKDGFKGELVVFAELLKSWNKIKKNKSGIWKNLFFYASFTLPFLLLFVIVYREWGVYELYGGLALPILLIVLWILTKFMKSGSPSQGDFVDRDGLMISFGGLSVLVLLSIVPALHIKELSFVGMDSLNSVFPYFLMFKSPFSLLSALLSLCAIFYIYPIAPIGKNKDEAFEGFKNLLDNLSQRIWMFAMFSFWVMIYAGGGYPNYGSELLGGLVFIIKLMTILLLAVVVKYSYPAAKKADAIEFNFQKILPLAVLAIIGEVIWVVMV